MSYADDADDVAVEIPMAWLRRAARDGISPPAELRNALAVLRQTLMGADHPDWELIVLLSYVIWWLTTLPLIAAPKFTEDETR